MPRTFDYLWDGKVCKVPVRDNQRSRVYAAERVLVKDRKILGEGSIQEAEAYVRSVEADPIWEELLKRSGRTPIPGGLKIESGRRHGHARGGTTHLVLPPWARSPVVILHEMAHSATRTGCHNWPFAAAFLVLVKEFLGEDQEQILKQSFKSHGVRYAPPRQISPEGLAKLREQGIRLAASRAQKS